MFFEANDGRQYPLSEIIMIGRDPHAYTVAGAHDIKPAELSIKLRDGRSATIFASEIDNIMRRPAHVIPALPGTYLLFSGVCEGEFYTNRTPVVGWAICQRGWLWPITPEGLNDDSDKNQTVITPDGIVIEPHNRQWDTFSAWEEDQRKRCESASALAPAADGETAK